MSSTSDQDARELVSEYVRRQGFARHQIESYENFMEMSIGQIMRENTPMAVETTRCGKTERHEVRYMSHSFGMPSIRERSTGRYEATTPSECHLRRLSYECSMWISFEYLVYTDGELTEHIVFRDKEFDRLPVMKHSKLCVLRHNPVTIEEDLNECGGTFLPCGTDKVMVGQEHIGNNIPFVTKCDPNRLQCEYRSFHYGRIRSTSTLFIYLEVNVPKIPEETLARRHLVPRVTVSVPYIETPIPIVSMYRLLGMHSVDDMRDTLCEEDDPPWFANKVWGILMADVAAVMIGADDVVERLGEGASGAAAERKARHINSIIAGEFLPNQGCDAADMPAKLACFATYVRQLIRTYYGFQHVNDRDSYVHKRCEMCGPILAKLFRKQWTQSRRRIMASMRKDLEHGSPLCNVSEHVKGNIGAHLQYALSTGNFSMARGTGNNLEGIAQPMAQTEPMSWATMVRRVVNQYQAQGKDPRPRQIHLLQAGLVCPYETPEGAACGLMRNMAITAGIRVGYSPTVLSSMLIQLGIVDQSGRDNPKASLGHGPKVFVSGYLLGTLIGDPDDALRVLRDARSTGALPPDVSIYRTTGEYAVSNKGELHVVGDEGMYYWPLLRTDKLDRFDEIVAEQGVDGPAVWTTLLTEGVVQLMCKDEEAINARVALRLSDVAEKPPGTYTHTVLHPTQLLGVAANKGPFIEFNQAPRNTYSSAMGKQAVGPVRTNADFRADTKLDSLIYPQKPLVGTMMDKIQYGSASGTNVMIAVLPYKGFNVEDALVWNRAFFDRGGMHSHVTRTVRVVERRHDDETIGAPPEGCRAMLDADYSKVDPVDGIVPVRARLQAGDVIVAKTAKKTGTDGEVVYRDRSVTAKAERETVTVSQVFVSSTATDDRAIRVQTQCRRVPEVGDKFCSRYGQKGVIGAIIPPEDMPFTASGEIPDVLINPHALPSRMTIGHLIETLMGTLATQKGEQFDASAFSACEYIADEKDPDRTDAFVNWIGDQLKEYGLDPQGEETFYCGTDGRKMQLTAFYGTCFYQKLRHMVRDKVHARSTGPVNTLTRQPREGRNRDGGLRWGEMERDNSICHGTSLTLYERLMPSSDEVEVAMCRECGILAEPPKFMHISQGKRAAKSAAYTRPICRRCLREDTVAACKIPYAWLVTVKEANAMNIDVKHTAAAQPARPVRKRNAEPESESRKKIRSM